MENLTHQDIISSEIATLRLFRDFCERHHLRYYLTFGTLLGAVRHKGFIPWDDDVDVFMPRPDYNFLLEHFHDENGREVISKKTVPEFYLDFAKIIDRNTETIEPGQTLPVGVWIDIFPMDILPDNALKRRLTLFRLRVLQYCMAYATLSILSGRAWYKNLLVPMWRFFCPSERSLEARYRKEVEKLSGNTTGEFYVLVYKFFPQLYLPVLRRSFFEPAVKLEFEGEWYDAPLKYDEFLRGCYGDYRILPPVEQRQGHSCVFHWKESPSGEGK